MSNEKLPLTLLRVPSHNSKTESQDMLQLRRMIKELNANYTDLLDLVDYQAEIIRLQDEELSLYHTRYDDGDCDDSEAKQGVTISLNPFRRELKFGIRL